MAVMIRNVIVSGIRDSRVCVHHVCDVVLYCGQRILSVGDFGLWGQQVYCSTVRGFCA